MYEAHDSLIASQMQMTGTRHGPVSSVPRRLFEFSSTTTQNVQHHDSPNRQVYQEATVTQEARKVLLNPTRSIREINKVPFKILDAPELRVSEIVTLMYFTLSSCCTQSLTMMTSELVGRLLSQSRRLVITKRSRRRPWKLCLPVECNDELREPALRPRYK